MSVRYNTHPPGLPSLHSKFFLLGFEHGLVLVTTLTREGITGTRSWTSHLIITRILMTNEYEIKHKRELWKWNQIKDDPCSCERNLCNCVRSQKKKFRTSKEFEPVTSRYQYSKILGSNPAEVLKLFFSTLLKQLLHKLHLQLQGSFLIWRILMLITSWILTSLAIIIICLQECGCSIFITCGMITLHSERWLSYK